MEWPARMIAKFGERGTVTGDALRCRIRVVERLAKATLRWTLDI